VLVVGGGGCVNWGLLDMVVEWFRIWVWEWDYNFEKDSSIGDLYLFTTVLIYK
jgi:hypothetical protein